MSLVNVTLGKREDFVHFHFGFTLEMSRFLTLRAHEIVGIGAKTKRRVKLKFRVTLLL